MSCAGPRMFCRSSLLDAPGPPALPSKGREGEPRASKQRAQRCSGTAFPSSVSTVSPVGPGEWLRLPPQAWPVLLVCSAHGEPGRHEPPIQVEDGIMCSTAEMVL